VGPASQGDLVISNNPPPLNLIKFTTPQPFRLPGPFHDLGEWQIAYFVARLEAHREFPHALLSGLRLTFQPAALVKFGYTNAFQAFGSGGVSLNPREYLEKIFVPTLNTTGRTVNGLVAYDVVLSVPFVRELPVSERAAIILATGSGQCQEYTRRAGRRQHARWSTGGWEVGRTL
jgi:Capsule assembly protein Wzi